MSNLQYYFQDIGVFDYDELFGRYYFPWADLTPVFLFCYVISYLHPQRSLKKKGLLLLIPFFVLLVSSLVLKALYWNAPDSDITYALRYFIAFAPDLFSGILGIGVIIYLFRDIKRFEAEQTENELQLNKNRINWLKITLFILIFLIGLSTSHTLSEISGSTNISYYPVWIAVSLIIYWLGHIGVYKFGIDQERRAIQRKRRELPKPKFDIVKPHPVIAGLKNYLIDEKQFLNSDLTLEKTASHLEMSQGHLSKIINSELQVSFSEYVNALRVEEAKQYLSDESFSNYTLVAIGLEAGFNSKSAFNSSFKKQTGTTPSQFKKAQGR